MRKPALAIIASCVLASLLFFLAPVFRQAFRVSLLQWHYVFHVPYTVDSWERADSTLETLAKKGEENHDADALAFVATRSMNQEMATRLANEAVHLDPKLTWIYANIFAGYPPRAEAAQWVAELEKFDPQNAVPYLMAAQRIGVHVVHTKDAPAGKEEGSPEWESAMDFAFRAPRLDGYFSKQRELERRVIARYGIDDPLEAANDGDHFFLPVNATWYSNLRAQALIENGEKLEADGDTKAALQKYLEVAKFGQRVVDNNYFLFYPFLGNALQHLKTLSEKSGNQEQAAFYAALADDAETHRKATIAMMRDRFKGTAVSTWSAVVARASGAAMLVSGLVLAICLIGVVIRGRSLNLAGLRPSGLTLGMACFAAVVALFSSVVLYVSYRPYSEIFQRFVKNGDESGLREMSDFLAGTQVPLGTGTNRFLDFQSAVFYFWLGIVLVCVCVLAVAVFRHLQTRRRTATA